MEEGHQRADDFGYKELALVSRYAGMFLVLVGGFYTFHNIADLNGSFDSSFVISSQNMLAETGGTLPPPPDGGEEGSTAPPPEGGGSGSPNEPIYEPPITIDVVGTEPLVGTVAVNVTVASASQVKVIAYYTETNAQHILGYATRVSGSVTAWRYNWNTNGFTPGMYRISVLVTNQYGTYDTSPVYKTVGIVTNETPPSSGTGESGTSETTEPEFITFSREAPLYGEVDITVNAPTGATAVKIRAVQLNGPTNVPIGNATLHSGNEWRLRWNADSVPHGEYRIDVTVYKLTSILSSGSRFASLGSSSTEDPLGDAPAPEPTDTTKATTSSDITLVVKDSPLAGTVPVFTFVTGAQFVEIHAIKKYSTISQFLGLATRVEAGKWRYYWNTVQVPNGEYKIYARVKDINGVRKSKESVVLVANVATQNTTVEQTTYITKVEDTYKEVQKIESRVGTVTVADSSNGGASSESSVDTTIRQKTDELLEKFKTELNTLLERLAISIRAGDSESAREARENLQVLKRKIINSILTDEVARDIINRIDDRISEIIVELESETVRREEVIRNRVGEEVFRDSDKDGISDYDEVNIYGTKPFVADTDGDGFTDGAEILNGFDPLNPNAEAVVQFESPQEKGTVRHDLLVVDSIESVSNDDEEDGVAGRALLKGRALPNSFVTLYIFSTPIIITVRTEDDGSWNYTFDKELEDGKHEVYAGVTDNAGRIIAKSNPLTFVKQAQAFTPVGASESGAIAPSTTNGPSFFSDKLVLLVLSVTVVSIGLVLLLLGLYIQRRRDIDFSS